jgi:DNA adenine methylase
MIIKFMGSKSRIAKYIVPIIQQYIDENNIEYYYDSMCGGCNVIDKIKCKHKYASDIQEYLIELYKNLDKIDELPEMVTREHYSDVRDCYNKGLDKYPKWYVGMVGFLASYNGRFMSGGYSGIVTTKTGKVRNYYDEAKRNLETQIPNLQDIEFSCMDYRNLKPKARSVIYLDPQYKDTKQYEMSKNFNHKELWQWVRNMSKEHTVIVSECQAPEDMTCIWQQEVLRTVDNTKRVKSTEKLFIYDSNMKRK